MKKSFVELLNEIVNDFKQIHINSKNDDYKEIDVFSKISELLLLVKEIENYNTINKDIIEKIFTLCHTYFGDDIGIIYEKNKDNNDYTKYYRYKYYRIETILEDFIYNNELQIKFYKLDVFEFESECAKILNSSSTTKEIELNKIGRETFLAEQIKLLKDIGVIKFCLDNKRITKLKLAEILSIILNRSEQNVRSFLTYYDSEEKNIPPRQKKYFLDTPKNIDFSDKILKKDKRK